MPDLVVKFCKFFPWNEILVFTDERYKEVYCYSNIKYGYYNFCHWHMILNPSQKLKVKFPGIQSKGIIKGISDISVSVCSTVT